MKFVALATALLTTATMNTGAPYQNTTSLGVGTTPNVESNQGLPEFIKGNAITTSIPGLSSLDPALGEDNSSFAIIRATFDGLTRTGEDGQPHPSMADKIDVSADLKTYTFTIRNAKWSNGETVTAHDFEYAWKRAINPETAVNYAYQLYYIKNAEKANKGEVSLEEVGIKALDSKTLQVTLENPTPYFLELTAFPTYYPVNKKVVSANPGWANDAKTHVGNGPFTIKSWEDRSHLVLAKNQQYWDKQSVKLDGINFLYVEDEYDMVALFNTGELDWAGDPLGYLPEDLYGAYKKEGLLHTKPTAGVYWLKVNTEKPPFNNAKIRKAFAYAVNRAEVIGQVKPSNLPATGVVPLNMSLQADGYFKDNDTTKAKQLLQEGLKELGLKQLPPISYSFNTSESHKRIAETIQHQWKNALGVDVKLDNKEWKLHLDDMHQGNYQIARMGWLGDFNDPINFLELFKDKIGGNNDTNWENPKYKELLDKSNLEQDPAKRKELLKQAEQIIMEDMPVIPIYNYTNSWVQNEKVKGIVLDGLGLIDYKWASKDK